MGELIHLEHYRPAPAIADLQRRATAYLQANGLPSHPIAAIEPPRSAVRPSPQPDRVRQAVYVPAEDGLAVKFLATLYAMSRLRILAAAALCGLVFGGFVYFITGSYP